MRNVFSHIPSLMNKHIKKIQLIWIFIAYTQIATINSSTAQQSNTIYLKTVNDLNSVASKGVNPLQSLLNTMDVKSFTQPIKVPEARGVQLSEYALEVKKIYRLEYQNEDLESIIAKLRKSNLFEIILPQPEFEVLYVTNDPLSQESSGQSPQIWGHDFPSAWDITKGDTNVVIGYVDTGIRFDHEDMQDNVKYNYADPINGLNDDGDFYFDSSMVDNYRGWDFGDWDNDPSVPSSFDHGLVVTSMGAATPDNNLGITGTGYNCKYMPIKVSTDAQPANLAWGYDGLLYAATQGCSVINLSWGVPNNYDQILQNYINYIVNDLDIVIVAAAGNSSVEELYYPASYQNVISVTGVTSDSLKQANSTYNHYVDVNVIDVIPKTARYNGSNYYGFEQGTSVASSIVSGAIGLIRSHRPDLKAYQIEPLIRATGFKNDTMGTAEYLDKIGYFLDPTKSLLDSTSSAMRMNIYNAYNNTGYVVNTGDTISIELDIVNYLDSTSENAQVILQAASDNIEIVDSVFHIGVLPTMDTVDNVSSPFKVYIKPTSNLSEYLVFRLSIEDNTQSDYQYFEFNLPITIVTKSDEEIENGLTISPIPAEDFIHISFENETSYTTYLLAMDGKLISSTLNNSETLDLDVSSVASGIYLLKIQTDDHTYSQKVIIE